MLKVHHLNNSRSQRILWLLEELQLPYEIEYHLRDARLAGPPAMKAAHPIGKAPIIEDNGRAMVESGAIATYILGRYGEGRLVPDPASITWMAYLEWMNIAVSSGYVPIVLKVYPRFLNMGVTPLDAAAQVEFDLVLGYMEKSLGQSGWILGDMFSAADIQLSFVAELAAKLIKLDRHPRVKAWLQRCQARPAFLASVARGGPYEPA